MNYTKGKWTARKIFKDPLLIRDEAEQREWYAQNIDIHDINNRILAQVMYQTDTKNQGYGHTNKLHEFEANAKLISKAPEMYEAIKLIVNDWDLPQSKISLGEKMQILKSLLKQIEKNEN